MGRLVSVMVIGTESKIHKFKLPPSLLHPLSYKTFGKEMNPSLLPSVLS